MYLLSYVLLLLRPGCTTIWSFRAVYLYGKAVARHVAKHVSRSLLSSHRIARSASFCGYRAVKILRLVFFTSLSLFLSASASATEAKEEDGRRQADEQTSSSPITNCNPLEWADVLFVEGDFYTSNALYTVALRTCYLDDTTNNRVRYKRSLCLLGGQRYEQAQAILNDLTGVGQPWRSLSRRRLVESHYLLADFDHTREVGLGFLELSEIRARDRAVIAEFVILSDIAAGHWGQADADLDAISGVAVLPSDRHNQFRSAITGSKDVPSRSIFGSILLSTLVPGLGQFACGQPHAALASLLVESIAGTFFGFSLWTASRTGATQSWIGLGIVGGILGIAHIVNIISGGIAARRFNTYREEKYRQEALSSLLDPKAMYWEDEF